MTDHEELAKLMYEALRQADPQLPLLAPAPWEDVLPVTRERFLKAAAFMDTILTSLAGTQGALVAAQAALYRWYETTHGNEFGHDHHCPYSVMGTLKGRGTRPADDKECSCGWDAFLEAEAHLAETAP